jgi:hypothetical protein
VDRHPLVRDAIRDHATATRGRRCVGTSRDGQAPVEPQPDPVALEIAGGSSRAREKRGTAANMTFSYGTSKLAFLLVVVIDSRSASRSRSAISATTSAKDTAKKKPTCDDANRGSVLADATKASASSSWPAYADLPVC